MPFMTDGKRDYRWSDEGRKCSRCDVFKNWESFNWKNDKKYKNKEAKIHQLKQPNCKECTAEQASNWRNNQTPERLKDLYLRRTYNITYLDFVSMLEKQEYGCKICGRDLDTSLEITNLQANSAVVDHCHETGKVRGILCNECNRGLGYFKDNITSLENAINYLTEAD